MIFRKNNLVHHNLKNVSYEAYTAGVLYPHIKKLFKFGLIKLGNEFDLLLQKTDWAKKGLFEYNERVLLGLFNNALVRPSDEYCTFQEYHVYKKEDQFLGRADLLISHKDFDILFEAKKWNYDDQDLNDVDSLFKEPRIQLIKYYEAEESYFNKKHSYLCVIIFEHVAEKYFKKIKELYIKKSPLEKGLHFDCFFEIENNGLMVYGQVFQPDNSSK
jgi:hypothetical protein